VRRFLAGLLLGSVGSLSLSIGLIPLLVAAALLLALGVALRSLEVMAGSLVGWGVTWLVLIGLTYLRCQARGPDCVSGGGELVFVAVGAILLVGGVSLSAAKLLKSRRAARSV